MPDNVTYVVYKSYTLKDNVPVLETSDRDQATLLKNLLMNNPRRTYVVEIETRINGASLQ